MNPAKRMPHFCSNTFLSLCRPFPFTFWTFFFLHLSSRMLPPLIWSPYWRTSCNITHCHTPVTPLLRTLAALLSISFWRRERDRECLRSGWWWEGVVRATFWVGTTIFRFP
jgi:hypothetical protein